MVAGCGLAFSCIHEPRDDRDGNGVAAQSDRGEIQRLIGFQTDPAVDAQCPDIGSMPGTCAMHASPHSNVRYRTEALTMDIYDAAIASREVHP
jgi:hypothetical protein